MSSEANVATKKLADLAVTNADQLTPLFAQLHTQFDAGASQVQNEESWKAFRDAWLARKSGVLTHVTDNWLKPAPPDLKRGVGAALNQLRAHVESKIEELRIAIESGATSTAATKDAVDLSLPVCAGQSARTT